MEGGIGAEFAQLGIGRVGIDERICNNSLKMLLQIINSYNQATEVVAVELSLLHCCHQQQIFPILPCILSVLLPLPPLLVEKCLLAQCNIESDGR